MTEGGDPMAIGERIKQQRLARRMSQDEVARAIQVTKQAVFKYESGIVTNIPMDKIEKMAQLDKSKIIEYTIE